MLEPGFLSASNLECYDGHAELQLDRISNERIREAPKVGEIAKKVQERRYNHVLFMWVGYVMFHSTIIVPVVFRKFQPRYLTWGYGEKYHGFTRYLPTSIMSIFFMRVTTSSWCATILPVCRGIRWASVNSCESGVISDWNNVSFIKPCCHDTSDFAVTSRPDCHELTRDRILVQSLLSSGDEELIATEVIIILLSLYYYHHYKILFN